MFDWINCDYPLPNGKGPPSLGRWDAAQFQTKDLDNGTDIYRITSDGRLLFEEWGNWLDDRTGQELQYTGDIEFYGGEGDGWAVYVATFSDGRLIEILDLRDRVSEDLFGLALDQIDEWVSSTLCFPTIFRKSAI